MEGLLKMLQGAGGDSPEPLFGERSGIVREPSLMDMLGSGGILGNRLKLGRKRGNESGQAKELETIYVKSLTRIFKVADKLAAGPVTDSQEIKPHVSDVLPDENQEKKYFTIGDRVVIDCSPKDFKYVQKKLSAWKKNMSNLQLQPGIVTDQNSTKDRTVQVYFPKIFSSCTISTAALEIDPNPEQLVARSQWKVGDHVKTRSHKKVVKVLMRRLPDIPKKYIGEPGKVISITTAGIFVTFDGLRSYAIDSALLQRTDRIPNLEIKKKPHPRDLSPGDKVKVISQLKTLINNQNGHGGWNRTMCSMAGKIGYITDVNDDDTIDVSCGFGRGWRMNHKSILKMDEVETLEEETKLEFNVGDKVKIDMTDDLRMHLIAKDITPVFLEYLLSIGEIKCIDDDFDVWTCFNSSSQICMKTSSLVKASQSEAENFEKIQKKLDSLEVGDTVYLDVGPPNYVRTILEKHEADHEIVRVLTSISAVIGWTDAQHAVIQYASGKKYRINRKYLTTPDRFHVRQAKGEFGLGTVSEMQTSIENCVKILHQEEKTDGLQESFGVDVQSMLKGDPPSVEFSIKSTVATSKTICERLEQLYGWRLEEMAPDTYMAEGFASGCQRVKMALLFDDIVYLSTTGSDESAQLQESIGEPAEQPSTSTSGGRARHASDETGKPNRSNTKDFSFYSYTTLQ